MAACELSLASHPCGFRIHPPPPGAWLPVVRFKFLFSEQPHGPDEASAGGMYTQAHASSWKSPSVSLLDLSGVSTSWQKFDKLFLFPSSRLPVGHLAFSPLQVTSLQWALHLLSYAQWNWGWNDLLGVVELARASSSVIRGQNSFLYQCSEVNWSS